MKLFNFQLLLRTLSSFSLGILLPASVFADSDCLGKSVCGYSQMPLLNQGSWEIQSAIKVASGSTFPGLCAPTAMTMFMQGYAREYGVDKSLFGDVRIMSSSQLTVLNFQNTVRQNEGTSIESIGELTSKFVNSSSQIVELSEEERNFENSDTLDPNANTGYVLAYIDVGFIDTTDYHDLVQDFRKHKTAGLVALCSNYQKKDCHALALNGVEGNRLKLFDPWGFIYTVVQTGEQIANASSQFGFVASFGGSVGIVGSTTNYRFYQRTSALKAKRRQQADTVNSALQTLLSGD